MITTNHKCILLVRVSTNVQDLDQQTVKVREAAIKDGYLPENIIAIEDKESAVKLSEDNRNGLNRLKSTIESDPMVDAVYSYEISRISRRAQVVYSIRDFLINHHIQLVILNPSFRLLKDDGTISETANIFFGIFSSMAENEGYLRTARVKRGKEKKRAMGRLTDGNPIFGYHKNIDKTLSVDPDTSKIVREIYARYLDGETCGLIAKDLWQRGVWSGRRSWTVLTRVSGILRESRYKGNGIYPRIVSDEDYDKAAEIRRSSNTFARKTATKEVYLSQGLLYAYTGYLMSSNPSKNRYTTKSSVDGVKSVNVNKDALDRLSSYLLKEYLMNGGADINREKELKELDKESKIIEKKLREADIQKDRINKENKMINARIIKGRLSEEEGDKMLDENDKLLFDIEEMIIDLNKRSNNIINRVIFINSYMYDGTIPTKFETPQKEQEMLRQHLKGITIWQLRWGWRRMVYEWKTGLKQEFTMYCANRTIKYFDKDGNQIFDPILEKKWG